METYIKRIKKFTQKKFFRYGLPFFIFVLGGSVGLKQFTELRFQYGEKCPITPEEAAKSGVKMRKPEEVTLESEYEKIKKLDIDNWTNVRGPRPWEESSSSS